MKTENYRHQKAFIFTLFGASGDLAKLKIFPALFELAEQKRMPETYWIIGYARSERTNEAFREEFSAAVKQYYQGTWGEYQDTVLAEMLPRITYFRGKYDAVDSFEAYGKYRNELTKGNFTQELFYFSVPPFVFAPIIKNIAEIPNLEKEKIKLVIEKPFGEDEATATELFHLIGERFLEEQVYLLDHYLGKQAVRSILPLRHNNRLLNHMMKGAAVSAIYINALEPFGVEERLGYFDQVGILRDMLQSHLLQILALTTMSIPITLGPKAIRQEKAAILSALHFEPQDASVSIGQYEHYCDDETCNPFTPTFAALKLFIDRESWYGVPIYLRSGKHLEKKETYITVELKKFSFQDKTFPSNRITLELSPDETLRLTLFDGQGEISNRGTAGGRQSISCTGDSCLSEHALLTLDVLKGDQTHFVSFSEIIACWQVMDQVIAYIKNKKPEIYSHGSAGASSQYGLTNTWYDL